MFPSFHRKRLRFRFYGDTTVDPPPASYEDAVAVYKSLPEKSLVDERVVSFSIAPLSDYCDQKNDILNEISNQNVQLVSQMMMDFNDVEKMLRKLKSKRLALDFQRYKGVLLDLEARFEKARSKFTSQIQLLLPNIRGGQDELALTELLQEYNSSPYEKERFLILLNTRKREIETAEFMIYHEELPEKTFIDLDNTGDMSKCVIDHDYTLGM